jgi:hypothetical protein
MKMGDELPPKDIGVNLRIFRAKVLSSPKGERVREMGCSGEDFKAQNPNAYVFYNALKRPFKLEITYAGTADPRST